MKHHVIIVSIAIMIALALMASTSERHQTVGPTATPRPTLAASLTPTYYNHLPLIRRVATPRPTPLGVP